MASPTNEAAGSSSSSLPRSSSDHQNHYRYQVFLSFRGEDTRYTFTDHLYTALRDRGIETFRDGDELGKGEEISLALLKAIEESRVSIIVFSQNYAASRWCLDELVKIMQCRESKGQEVRPVFYKVDPSHVRHQRGAFGDAFAKLDQGRHKDSMGKWREALKEAANLSGWSCNDDMYEAKLIREIVEELSAQVINPSCLLEVAAHPIGLESCTQDVKELLRVEENSVRMVGIWGPGGIGKTTIAKAVFNSIRHKFDGSCFLEDVRSNSSSNSSANPSSIDNQRLAQLQERLLSKIIRRGPALKVNSVAEGETFIKTKMKQLKVLLILDDVSDYRQLQKLAPYSDCFGPGSRILITTRDKHSLTAHGVDEVYDVKMLDDDQSMKLFSLNAFKEIRPPEDYIELAQRAVSYAGGLPLALTLLGSHLCRRSRDEWKATLASCKREEPHVEIRSILKISYDALGVDLKGYFLDIACFFKGKYVHDVIPILEACYNPKPATAGITQLQQKALIRIEEDYEDGEKIWMHDLIEEMGKEIVHQESPDEPGGRSRLWCKKDVHHVLTNNKGTDKVTGIHVELDMVTVPNELVDKFKKNLMNNNGDYTGANTVPLIHINSSIPAIGPIFRFGVHAKSFSNMKKLRYISIGEEKYNLLGQTVSREMIDYLSEDLRWLDWSNCPPLPPDFHANDLVKLNISCSLGTTKLWDGDKKDFSRLTSMKLSGCESLTKLPDFKRIPNLKELELYYCESLIEIPDSVGLLVKLVTLRVHKCSNLVRFPRKIKMCSLRRLHLSFIPIEELHLSIRKLIGLEDLIIEECQNLTCLPHNICKLSNLKDLVASKCSKLATFPKITKKMECLRKLCLKGSPIRELDESIGNLVGLENLILEGCKNLTSLPCSIYELQDLRYFYLNGCSELVRFPTNTKILNANGCSLPKLQELRLGGCSSLSDWDFLMTLGCRETLEKLELSGNNLVTLPPCVTKFVKLQDLYLQDCEKLEEFSDVEVEMVSLRSLNLSSTCIVELHPSITKLIGLEELRIMKCQNLTTLPDNIFELRNLKVLDVRGCPKLATFPEIPRQMNRLEKLYLNGSDIRELDESLGNLIGLQVLHLSDCKNLTSLPCSIYGLQHLEQLDLSGCSKLVRFPTHTKISNANGFPKLEFLALEGCSSLSVWDFLMTLDCCQTLEYLNLSRNNFVSLPACFTKFVNLRELNLEDCKRLRQRPEVPPNLMELNDFGCESLEIGADLSRSSDESSDESSDDEDQQSSYLPQRLYGPEEQAAMNEWCNGLQERLLNEEEERLQNEEEGMRLISNPEANPEVYKILYRSWRRVFNDEAAIPASPEGQEAEEVREIMGRLVRKVRRVSNDGAVISEDNEIAEIEKELCKFLERLRFRGLSNGAVISREIEEQPTPSSRLSLASEPLEVWEYIRELKRSSGLSGEIEELEEKLKRTAESFALSNDGAGISREIEEQLLDLGFSFERILKLKNPEMWNRMERLLNVEEGMRFISNPEADPEVFKIVVRWLRRVSNDGPLITARFEGQEAEELREIMGRLVWRVRRVSNDGAVISGDNEIAEIEKEFCKFLERFSGLSIHVAVVAEVCKILERISGLSIDVAVGAEVCKILDRSWRRVFNDGAAIPARPEGQEAEERDKIVGRLVRRVRRVSNYGAVISEDNEIAEIEKELCKFLVRFSGLSNDGAVISGEIEEEPTPKQHRSTEEPAAAYSSSLSYSVSPYVFDLGWVTQKVPSLLTKKQKKRTAKRRLTAGEASSSQSTTPQLEHLVAQMARLSLS